MIDYDVDILKGKNKNGVTCVEIHFKGNIITIDIRLPIGEEYFVVDSNLVVAKCKDFDILRVRPVETIGDVVDGILESLGE